MASAAKGNGGNGSRSATPTRAAAAADPAFSGEFTAGVLDKIRFTCECGKQFPQWTNMLGHLKGTGHMGARSKGRDVADLREKCEEIPGSVGLPPPFFGIRLYPALRGYVRGSRGVLEDR